MTNRRSSIYTIRLTNPGDVALVTDCLTAAGTPVVDQGDASVSFRAADDDAANRTLDHALSGYTFPEHIVTTGLGVHRRTVT